MERFSYIILIGLLYLGVMGAIMAPIRRLVVFFLLLGL